MYSIYTSCNLRRSAAKSANQAGSNIVDGEPYSDISFKSEEKVQPYKLINA